MLHRFGLDRPPGADDGGDRPVRVLLSRGPGDDGQAHDPQALPVCPRSKTGAVFLDPGDHRARQSVVGGIVAVKTNGNLVQHDLVQMRTPASLARAWAIWRAIRQCCAVICIGLLPYHPFEN